MRPKSPRMRDALPRATLRAVSSRSTATPRHVPRSASRLTAMQPLPVPRSSSVPRAGPCWPMSDSAVSTSCQTVTVSITGLQRDRETYHFGARTRYERAFDRCHIGVTVLYQVCISLYQGCISACKHVAPEGFALRDVAQWLASHSSRGQSNGHMRVSMVCK